MHLNSNSPWIYIGHYNSYWPLDKSYRTLMLLQLTSLTDHVGHFNSNSSHIFINHIGHYNEFKSTTWHTILDTIISTDHMTNHIWFKFYQGDISYKRIKLVIRFSYSYHQVVINMSIIQQCIKCIFHTCLESCYKCYTIVCNYCYTSHNW